MVMSLRAALTDSRASAIPHTSVRPSAASVWALGRIETKRMLLHPAFLIGMGFPVLLARGLIGGRGTVPSLSMVTLGLLLGLLIGTVLTANIAALRPSRDHVQELFGALPAAPETRTAGVFVGLLLGPVAISVVLTGLGWMAFRTDASIGPSLDLFLAVQIPLTIAAVGAIGIALGRWVPSLLGGPVIIAAHIFTGVGWAVPWVQNTDSGIHRGWHMVYLAAALTTWVVAAFARDRRTVWRFAIGGGAFALGVWGAFHQIPPGGLR